MRDLPSSPPPLDENEIARLPRTEVMRERGAFHCGGQPAAGLADSRMTVRARPGLGRAGVSLMELVTVLFIVGVMTGTVFPRIGDAWEQFAVRGAADQFVSAHQKARTAAVRFGAVAELHIDASADRFWVQIDTTLARSGVMDTIGAVVDLSEDQVDLRANRSLLCFDPRGLVATAAGCPSTGAVGVGFFRGSASDTTWVIASGMLFQR